MSDKKFTARPYVLHEANFAQLKQLKPNVAVLPWGATEAHNYHLPYGTDVVEATMIAEAVVEKANAAGARCVVLPTVPFGNDNTQLTQLATITMRTRTQQAVLFDVADSLVRQGIDRLVILNAHGGNDFKQLVRDVSLDLPIFIVAVNAAQVASAKVKALLTHPEGDHAHEGETCLMMHLAPQWVAPLETAADGAITPSKLPAISNTPGVWAPRDWAALTASSGVGDPRQATAEKGRKILDLIVAEIVPVLTQLSAAKNGDFPYVVRK